MKHLPNLRNILLNFLLLACACATRAQGVFPVSLNGVLIPPRSMDLAVYGTLRTSDLFFTATLIDPVEPFRDVRLQLYIESNNRTIYVTDPNAALPVTRLFKDEPKIFDGFALQPYLQPAALIGASGEGTGAVIMPEGYGRILLELIDIERNVPISRKAAVGGNFVFNDPPFTNAPANGAQFSFPVSQNITFSWTPRHIGSLNPPGAVEYLFKLVELTPGVADPNDGFDNNLTIYQTTTFIPTLHYSIGQPILLPNKVYAWRVQARPAVSRGAYFRNLGFSNVCTFSLLEAGELAEEGGGLNEEHRTPPTGCVAFDTDFGPVSGSDIIPALITVGDAVKLGWFDLEITNVYPSNQGYAGKGVIAVPFLASKIKVNFTNLKVKEGLAEKRVYAVGSVRAELDKPFAYDPLALSTKNLDSVFTEIYCERLEAFFASGDGLKRTLSQFDPQSPPVVSLPIVIDRKPDSLSYPPVMVTGIRFSPRNAYLTCVAAVCNSAGSLVRYAAFEIPCTPFGVKTKSRLSLLTKVQIPLNQHLQAELTAPEKDMGMGINCLGFKEYKLAASLNISARLLTTAGKHTQIRLPLPPDVQDADSYVGVIPGLPASTLADWPGMEFSSDAGSADLDTNRSLSAVPEIFSKPQWRGLLFENARVRLPLEYNFSGRQGGLVLENGLIALDEAGFSGVFHQTNLETGRFGGWPLSIDVMHLAYHHNKPDSSYLSGKIQLPLFPDPFPYRGRLFEKPDLTLLLQPAAYPMPMWGGSLQMLEGSRVGTIQQVMNGQKRLFPAAAISGLFSATFHAAELQQKLSVGDMALLTSLAGTPSFKLELKNIPLSGFRFGAEATSTASYALSDKAGGMVTLGDQTFQVQGTALMHRTEGATERLGLELVFQAGGSRISMVLWAETGADNQWTFHHVELKQ